MPHADPQTVIVILTGSIVPAGLARAAVRNGWPLIHGPLDAKKFRQSLIARPYRVAIVHIPVAHDDALDLVRRLREDARATVVVAVGIAGSELDETLARAAGASLFLPDTINAEAVEHTVRALVGAPHQTTESRRSAQGGPKPAPRSRTAG